MSWLRWWLRRWRRHRGYWELDPNHHGSGHLRIEQREFRKQPHAWIQWKGTNVCADIHCECGHLSHYDGDFMYFIRCPNCRRIWEVGSHIALYPSRLSEDDSSIQEAEL